MLRIGMLTSGGDCQALNAAMRGVVKGLVSKRDDVEIYGFQDGYKGLIYSNFKMLTSKDFSGILTLGGTILGTSRQPFKIVDTSTLMISPSIRISCSLGMPWQITLLIEVHTLFGNPS